MLEYRLFWEFNRSYILLFSFVISFNLLILILKYEFKLLYFLSYSCRSVIPYFLRITLFTDVVLVLECGFFKSKLSNFLTGSRLISFKYYLFWLTSKTSLMLFNFKTLLLEIDIGFKESALLEWLDDVCMFFLDRTELGKG